jgi:hypothetical protein
MEEDMPTAKKTVRKPVQKTAKKVTFEDVWAGFDRLEKLHKKTEKAQEDAWKAIKEMQRNLGGINNTLESLVEHIMIPGLPGKFKLFGFTFDKITTVKWAVEGSIYKVFL